MHERELKMEAPAAFVLPDLGDVAAGLEASPGAVQRLRTTYWDTDDLRLGRWGCTLRHRAHEGWTVKLPGEVLEDMLVRPELTFEGRASAPPREALDLLVAFLRRARVRPVIRLRTDRSPVELRSGDGPTALVTLDDVSVVDDGRVTSRFREIEVEVAEGSRPETLDAIRDRLEAAGAGASDPTPKHVRALGDRLAGPEVEVPHPGPTSATGEVIRWALATSVQRLILHDPAVRLSADSEAVHQCRVATRRLRSDLATFRGHVESDRTEPLRAELRWLAGALGQVRDSDVLVDLLSGFAEALPDPADRKAAAAYVRRLTSRRNEARTRLLEAMGQGRYVDLLEEVVRIALDPAVGPEADRPAKVVLRPLVDRAWRRLRRAVGGMSDPPTDEELHGVRIRAKRCRYAAESAAPVLGKPWQRFARRVERIQDILGEHQDAVVAEGWLREVARGTTGPRSFVGGILVGSISELRITTRQAFPTAWRKASSAAEGIAR